MKNIDLEEINKMILEIESAAKGLIDKSQGIQAIQCNAKRIMASAKMLKINISDLIS